MSKALLGFIGSLLLVSLSFGWAEEQVDSMGTSYSGLSEAHSTFHYELMKLIAYKAGFSITESELIARYDALVDLANPKENNPNGNIPLTTSIPQWTESLAGTERLSLSHNTLGESPGVYWHFPFRSPTDPVAGAFVYGTSYPVTPGDTMYRQNPYFWRAGLTTLDYLTSMKNWAIFGTSGSAGLPDANSADTVQYYVPSLHGYLPVEPMSLAALGIYLHCLADSYSHEECMLQDTTRTHPIGTRCGSNYHYQELPYAASSYGRDHVDGAAKAMWRGCRAYISGRGLGYAARWTTDANGFEDGDEVPDALEDNGNLNHNETFIEQWKTPASVDLTGDRRVNHYDHTFRRIQLALDEIGTISAPEPTVAQPTGFEISSIHPNPFNATTVIHFTLDRDATTSLRVYDVSGRLVRTILTGEWLHSGMHEIRFTADGMPGGMYLCSLQSGTDVAFAKFVYIK